MKTILNWLAATASFIGLFFTLKPNSESWTELQTVALFAVTALFVVAAVRDICEERRRAAKSYKTPAAINDYMHVMLRDSGRCEICSRDASWITDSRIYTLLKGKARRGELTFLVHKSTSELQALAELGAEVIVYGPLGFEPITRFTIANAGNQASSYVAVGRRKLNEPHTIEEVDSSHPTYSMALDLIRSIRVANDQFKKS